MPMPGKRFAMRCPLFAVLVPLAIVVSPQLRAAQAETAPPLGIDLGASGPVNPRGGEGHSGFADPNRPEEVAHNGHNDVHASGTVKAVNSGAHKVTISHQPISQIGWPAMTMEFTAAPAVDLSTVKPGAQVNFSMEQGADGMYVIQSIAPAGGGH